MEPPTLEKDSRGHPYIKLGENVLRFEDEDLDDLYRERAAKEIRETPEIVEQSTKALRQLIQDEKKLNVPLDDEFLFTYLRPCKFYPDTAFKIMKKFYKVKLKHPKYFYKMLPSEVSQVYADGVVYFLPKRCNNGARIMVMQIGKSWDTKEINIVDFMSAILVASKVAMDEPKTQVGGVHVILDMDGLSMAHIWQFTPSITKLISYVVTECLPLRLLGYHIINQAVIFDILYNVFKPFLSEKISKKVFFHGTDWKSLHKWIDEECVPVEWGGSLKSPECPGKLLKQLMNFYEFRYEKIRNYGYIND